MIYLKKKIKYNQYNKIKVIFLFDDYGFYNNFVDFVYTYTIYKYILYEIKNIIIFFLYSDFINLYNNWFFC